MISRRGVLKGIAALICELPLRAEALPSGLYLISFYGTKKDGFGYEPAKMFTASGELFDPKKLTCAHRTLPFGTKLKINNPQTEREIIVRVNDRGPFHTERELDVSFQAAQELDFTREGSLLAYIEREPYC